MESLLTSPVSKYGASSYEGEKILSHFGKEPVLSEAEGGN